MPAPKLRHYRLASGAAGLQEAVGPVVPTDRALVISKITVARRGAVPSASLSLSIGTTAGTPGNVVNGLAMAPGESFTETGLVALAGESVYVYSTEAGAFDVNVFGQEVDNL